MAEGWRGIRDNVFAAVDKLAHYELDEGLRAAKKAQEAEAAAQETFDRDVASIQTEPGGYVRWVQNRLAPALPAFVEASLEYEHAVKLADIAANKMHVNKLKQAGATALQRSSELSHALRAVEVEGIDPSRDQLETVARWAKSDLAPGMYTLVLQDVEAPQSSNPFGGDDDYVRALLIAKLGHTPADAQDLAARVKYVGPQAIAAELSLEAATHLKDYWFGSLRLRARLREPAPAEGSVRNAIPERVRHEVWRRDEGRCVDCGSRERLEFDHIIPISRGGPNTALNLELRCDDCHGRKTTGDVPSL